MQRSKKDVESALKKKGFIQQEGNHHFFRYHTPDGQPTSIITKTSHSGKDIGDNLLKAMSLQCKLQTAKEFLNLVDCPMSKEDYHEHLTESGVIIQQQNNPQ